MKPGVNKKSKEPVKVLSQAEQEAIIKEEIVRFLTIAKEKKVLSIEEINELLPPEIMLASVLDFFMQSLESNGVSKLCPSKYEFKGDIEELNKLLIKRYEK